MNPYYRVACVGYSSTETRRFTSCGAQQRRLVRFVPVANITELKTMAPRRRFDAVLISSTDFAACPAGSLALRSQHDAVLPVFVNGVRTSRASNHEEAEAAIYISFKETPVESAAFRLCTENMLDNAQINGRPARRATDWTGQELGLQDILDGCSDAIVVTDAGGNIRYANRTSGLLFDCPVGELVGKRIGFLSSDVSATEYVLQRSSGVNISVEISTRQTAHGEIPIFIHTLRDVTERNARQSAEIAEENSRRQMEKWRCLEALATGISHQFNNLLMIIFGHCSRMKGKNVIEAGLLESILQIEKSSTRAADITSHLLTFAGLGKYEFSAISVSDTIEKLHYLFDAIAFRRAVIEYNLDRDIPQVKGDPSQLQRMLFDVVNNALESIQSERGVISVTTGWINFDPEQIFAGSLTDDLPAGRYAYIQVSDTGCGMDEEIARQIFQPFYTTKESRRGLGLSAALGIVRAHHGAMGVHSMAGRGTTIEIFLPVAESQVCIEASFQDDGGSRLPYDRPLRLLIAEDESDLREVVSEYLIAVGCEVVAAEDGKVCVERFRESGRDFDCIILDMSMPNMDGEETFEALRSLGSAAPVIVTSGFTDNATISRLKAAGAAFLQKPYHLTVLEDLMKREIVQNLARQPEISRG